MADEDREDKHVGDRRNTGWRINKEIPVSVLLVVVLQAVSSIWFIAKLDARISLIEERRQDDKVAMMAVTQLPERMTRTESNMASLTRSVERLEEKLDRQRLDVRAN